MQGRPSSQRPPEQEDPSLQPLHGCPSAQRPAVQEDWSEQEGVAEAGGSSGEKVGEVVPRQLVALAGFTTYPSMHAHL